MPPDPTPKEPEPQRVPQEARTPVDAKALADARQAEKTRLDKFVAHAVNRKFHPVIVFGGSGSGKTAVIMSLIRLLLMRPNGVGVELDGTFFAQDPDRVDRIKDARTYLETTFQDFKAGT